MTINDLKTHLQTYITSLEQEVNTLLQDKSISQENKNAQMRKLADKKNLIIQTMDSLDIIENKTYIPHCGSKI